MQDIKPVRVFLKVAELRSFVAAARSLRMTPASVTRIVAKLEQDLRQQLFVRTTRQVALTTAGNLVAVQYAAVVADFDRVTADITNAILPDQGHLAINAPMSLGQQILPALLSSFRLAYPNIAVVVTLTDTLIDIVDAGCDLAIRISGPPSDKSTIWRKICEVPRFAVAAPSLWARFPRPIIPDDLQRSYCMSYASNGQAESWQFRKNDESRSVSAGTSIIANNGDFLFALAKSANGVAVLPGFIVQDGLSRGDVECVLPDWEVSPLWLTLYYPPYPVLPPLVATFTEFFEEYLREVPVLRFQSSA